MINTLHIKNIGIIDDITVNFNEGFNVLTGETGAGKTLIIDSLGIIAGGRFSKEMIRKGENHSFVEISLFLPQNRQSIDGTIIVSREIYSNGRNTCKINGRLVTVAELKKFMSNILDIHGQNDNQSMMNPTEHIMYLDNFIGSKLLVLKEEYKELYLQYTNVKNELKQNYGDDREKQRKLDLLNYQLNEIEKVKLKPKEDYELEKQRKVIANSEKIFENLNLAEQQLNNNVLEGLNSCIKSLEKIEFLDESYSKLLENIHIAYYSLEESTHDILNLASNIDFDEQTRNKIEERLDTIYSMKRKYGNSIEEILEYKISLEEEILSIQNREEYITHLKENLVQLEKQMLEKSLQMNQLRNQYAISLSDKVNNELKDLEMQSARFKVNIIKNESEFNLNGIDTIEFLICTNIGEEFMPLIKIASGGELSRIMLAIKTVLADIDQVSTMVFDEIDTGISGKAAKAVSEKMERIAKKHQIFVVTHLAIIAAHAQSNFFISKLAENEKTKTNIHLLKEEEVIREIARILTGEVTETAIQHATELRRERIAI